MRLSFSEIRQRAIRFGHDWKDETSERAEAQTFWNDFFNVFGIPRRSVASFERTVRNLYGAHDRIDVIWQGAMLGEHKSRGQDLSKAQTGCDIMKFVRSIFLDNLGAEFDTIRRRSGSTERFRGGTSSIVVSQFQVLYRLKGVAASCSNRK